MEEKGILTPAFFDYLCQYVPYTYFIFVKIINVCVFKPKLPLPNVSTMLSGRIVAIVFNFVTGKYPIAYYVAPYCNPYKHITAGRLDLLKVHIKTIF